MNKLITDELIENTYLFCMKRVSDSEAARDLSHDILCAALSALGRGKNISDFHGWYWRMARNKYADYVCRRKDRTLPLESAGGAAVCFPDLAERLITREDMSELNFALSRLAATQRELVIRFYLKEQSVSRIASELDLPEGTVKYRLFDARKNIKERFDHMNNYGKSSYAPAHVDWFFGYSVWKAGEAMQSNIAPQVLVICRSKAVSINEIADEIGVAPVYLEPVLEKMANADILKRQGKDKYIANHCVFPMQAYSDAQYEAYKVFREGNYPEKIIGMLMGIKDEITAMPFYGNDFDYSYLMWILLVYAADKFGILGNEKYMAKYIDKYPDEKERTYRMTVEFALPDENINWHEIKTAPWSNLHQKFDTLNILEYINDFECKPFPAGDGGRDKWVNATNVTLLEALTENPSKSLNRLEEEQAARFIEQGLLKRQGNGLKVMLPLIDREVFNRLTTLIENAVREYAQEYSAALGERVEKILLPHVRRDLMSNFIHWDMRIFFQPTGYLFRYAMDETDCLAKPEDYSRSAAGLWLMRYYRGDEQRAHC